MTKIVKGSLHDEAVARIREMIFEGELAPGSRIPEKQLCERFGISRTPLREALKVLASEGLVELLPNRGSRVVRLTPADIEHTFQVMGALEALSGELACAQISDRELEEIRALHHQMLAHYHRRERPAYFRLNQEIHEAIVAAARNPVLSSVYHSLSGRVRRSRYQANMSPERWAQAVREHEDILQALAERDGPRLAAILREHLSHKLEVVRESEIASGRQEAGETVRAQTSSGL